MAKLCKMCIASNLQNGIKHLILCSVPLHGSHSFLQTADTDTSTPL